MTIGAIGRHTNTWDVGNWGFYKQLVDRKPISMLTIRTNSEDPTVAEWAGGGWQSLETRYTKSSQFQI